MANETNDDNEFMAIDPEMERIWREDDEPSFTELRASMESEQPEETAETEDSDEEETVSTEEDDTEVEEESDKDQPETTEEKSEQKAVSTHKVKANDMEFDFTVDELKALAPKAMDYTKKMQEIAPWRKTISALKDQGLGEADVNLMIDALKGDKSAITEMLKRTQVDPLELDTDSKEAYQPKQYGKDETTLAIEDVVNDISSDPEYATTAKVVDEVWDSESRRQMASNPALIKGLHEEIKMGRYSIVAPMAMKMKTMDSVRGSKVVSDLEYYQQAVNAYLSSEQGVKEPEMKEVVASDKRQTEIKDMSSKRKAASPTKSMAGKRDVINYLDDDDEDFDSWYKSRVGNK